MSDEYGYRVSMTCVSMTCATHGGIFGYTYCPECTISALRELEKIAERAGDVEGMLSVMRSTWAGTGSGTVDDAVKRMSAALSRWLKGE